MSLYVLVCPRAWWCIPCFDANRPHEGCSGYCRSLLAISLCRKYRLLEELETKAPGCDHSALTCGSRCQLGLIWRYLWPTRGASHVCLANLRLWSSRSVIRSRIRACDARLRNESNSSPIVIGHWSGNQGALLPCRTVAPNRQMGSWPEMTLVALRILFWHPNTVEGPSSP